MNINIERQSKDLERLAQKSYANWIGWREKMIKKEVGEELGKIKIKIEREYCKYCGSQIPPTRETCPVCYKKAKKYVVITKVSKEAKND